MRKCKICGDKFKTGYGIYQLLYDTEEHSYRMGMKKLCDTLSIFVMEKGYHLSATQIILFRPDILRNFLEEERLANKDETLERFYLEERIICDRCYGEYTQLVPLR